LSKTNKKSTFGLMGVGLKDFTRSYLFLRSTLLPSKFLTARNASFPHDEKMTAKIAKSSVFIVKLIGNLLKCLKFLIEMTIRKSKKVGCFM